MIAAPVLEEYLEEIRKEVCSRCVTKPNAGPPCAPLGKDCGVELHLPELIESIRQVHSPLIDPYRERNRNEICAHCSFLHSSICPCPMDYLSVLLVQAVETVDERRRQRGEDPVPECGAPNTASPSKKSALPIARQRVPGPAAPGQPAWARHR